MFIHHVFFWLIKGAGTENRDQLIKGLKDLSKVKSIKSFHIGVPANTNRPVIERSYSVSWMLTFDTPEAQASYQDDPLHLKFIADCAHLWEKVVVYDSVNAG